MSTLPEASSSGSSSPSSRLLDGRYALGEAIGHGASATVYVAQDRRLDRRVAVKTALPALAHDPRFLKRFRAEARAAAQLSHPHLLAVFDWADDPDNAYLVTEYLSGGSLRSMLEAGHRLTLSQALMIGLHAAEGLEHAHGRGVVHRDIKPANILFGSDGRLRIADFGIARAVAEAAWTEPEGALIGTARYAAPEQATGDAVDGRSDVYSLALTLIETVTGSVPLVGSTPLATMVGRQDTDIPRIDEMGPLADILEAAGRVDPSQRPDSAAFARGLAEAAKRLPRPEPLPLIHLGEPSAAASPTAAVLDVSRDPTIDLTGRPQPSVEINEEPPLDESGFFDADLDPDLASEPVGGRGILFVAVGLVVLIGLVIGAIVAFPREAVSPATTVPEAVAVLVDDFVGGPIDVARQAAEANGWIVVETERREDGTTPGEVLDQTPVSGTELAEGATLRLVVSAGSELRVMPDVVGLERSAALAAISDADLVVGTIDSEVFDEEVAAGSVISASVTALDEVETGTVVDLEVSAGPEPRIVPDLSGLTAAEAEPILLDLGLVIALTDDYSTSVGEGLIVSSVPALGESIARDGTVTVVVSLGLPFITVPDVTGMTAIDAEAALIEAGFVVAGTQGSPSGEVLVTNPPAGETYRLGHEILIITR